MTAVDEIKQRIDIVDFVSQSVKLRRTGKNYSGFCPFHPNSRTPAFAVFPESGTWRCFGQCNEGGDIFKFVMKKEGWDFATALRYLAEKAGVQLEALSPEREAEKEEHARLRALLEDAVTYFRHHLIQDPAGKPAFDYLLGRGIKAETIENFGLGYALPGWENILAHFKAKGFSDDELLQAGLVTEREGGGVRDRFHNRIMFPIRDGMGKMAGFGARILDPNDVPKFLNSPQTPLFDKGRLLYGLDAARKSIRDLGQAVIVEGYLDVIALHQAGFTNAVSPMGTALTEDQLRLLKRFTKRMVLALDADAAGEKATLRGLELARETLDRSDEVVFDARGLLRHEARLQADVLVVTLPEGKDPDDVVLADPEAWKQVMEKAKPIVVHVMDTLAASHDLNDPKEKREIARQVLPLIEDVPSAIEREDYRQKLARLLKIDERALIGARQPVIRSRRRGAAMPSSRGGAPRRPSMEIAADQQAVAMERHVLRLLLRQPEEIYALDRSLQSAGLSRFSVDDFEQTDHRELARLIEQAINQDQMDALNFISSQVSGDLSSLLQELSLALPAGEPNPAKRLEDLIRTMILLRQLRINQGINQLRFMQEEAARDQADTQLNPFHEMIRQYTQARARLDQALVRPIQAE